MTNTNTPRYVVEKVGDHFVTIRQNELKPTTSALFTLGGAYATMWGLKTRGLPGLSAIALGACLFYRGATGKSLVDRLFCGTCSSARKGATSDSPSHPHQGKSKSDQVAADDVDEAAMESFPASDPPSGHRSTV